MAPAACLALAAVLTAVRGDAAVIVSCGFEPFGDTWSTANSGGGFLNTDPGGNDSPNGQRILGGTGSWSVNNSTSHLVFSEVFLSGWTNLSIRYHVSSTVYGGDGGHTPDDYVAAYVATATYDDGADPAYGPKADVTLQGYGGGAVWGFDHTAPVEKEIEWGGVVSPQGEGVRADDGYNDFTIRIPNSLRPRSLAFKLSIKNIGPEKYWNIDDVGLEGTPTISRDLWWNGGHNELWDNSDALRWDASRDGTSDSPWDGANGDNAYFAGSGETVKIASAATVAARSLTFAADGCTIEGGDSKSRLVLTAGGSGGAGANAIEVVDADHTATIDAVVAGNPGAGLIKTGAGTLVLAKANNYKGQTTIKEGTLRISRDNQLSTTGAGVVFDGGTLQFGAAIGIREDRPVTFLAGGGAIDTRQFDCAAATTTWSGEGALTKLGSGTLGLSGANDAFGGEVHVREGILRLENNGVLDACPTINVAAEATLDLSGVAEGYRFGSAGGQTLQGSGNVLGNLEIGRLGVHDLGLSPGVQYVEGDYSMNGLLHIEVGGPTPGAAGYDQVRISGRTHDVSLGGALALAFSGSGWAAPGDELWIIRNETDGALTGTFLGLDDGAVVGVYDGFLWQIRYGDQSGGGNDVLLVAVETVPEPGSLGLLLIALGAWRIGRKVVRGACHPTAM